MSEQPQSRNVVVGASVGLFVVGLLVALFASLAFGIVLILASGLQRRPQGLIVGTVLQVPLLLTGLLNGAMWIVGGAFFLAWLYMLQIRKELLGAPFGPPRPRTPPDPPPTG